MGPGLLNTNFGQGPVNTNSRPGVLNTNWGPGPVNTNWGPGPVNTNLGPGPVNTNCGPGLGAGGREIQIPIKVLLIQKSVYFKVQVLFCEVKIFVNIF